jgi:hypothetical protein
VAAALTGLHETCRYELALDFAVRQRPKRQPRPRCAGAEARLQAWAA